MPQAWEIIGVPKISIAEVLIKTSWPSTASEMSASTRGYPKQVHNPSFSSITLISNKFGISSCWEDRRRVFFPGWEEVWQARCNPLHWKKESLASPRPSTRIHMLALDVFHPLSSLISVDVRDLRVFHSTPRMFLISPFVRFFSPCSSSYGIY